MDINYKNMGNWEKQKALFLQKVAIDLGMDISGYGMLDVNPNSGYTYLWLEDHQFTLYMPISCELKKTDVYALWTSSEDGEEIERKLGARTTLAMLDKWAEDLSEKANT